MIILLNDLTISIIGSVVLSIIILILLFVLFFLVRKIKVTHSKKKKTQVDQILNNFYDSDKFSEFYNQVLEKAENYDGLNEENFKYYENLISPKKPIKTYDQLIVLFNKKTNLFLDGKFSLEEYSNLLEAYIYLEGFIKKDMIEKTVSNNNLSQDIFVNYDEERFDSDNVTYPDELADIAKEIELNNHYTSSEIELLDENYYRNYDEKITNIIYPIKVSDTTPRPKIASIYKPTRSVVLHVDQVFSDMEKVVEKMSTEEQMEYLEDFFE